MPLLDLIWTMFLWFLVFALISAVIAVITDIFRSHDLSGIAKAGWILLVVVIPWLGVGAYLVVRGDSMEERYAAVAASKHRDRHYYQKTSYNSDADQLAQLDAQHQAGLLTAMDYDTQKARILS